MILNIAGLEDASKLQEPKMRIAIVGEPKVGKSWLAVSGEGTKYVCDFDKRASSLAGKPGVMVKTYHDTDTNNPKAISELEADISTLQYAKAKGDPIPEWFILDSITYARKATEAELIRQQSTLGRSIRVGTKQLKIGAGWDIINGNRAYLEYLVNTLGELGNVIAVFHTQDEKDNVKSTPTQKAYTGRITIQPQYLSSILSIFNDVWLVDIGYNGKRFVQTGLSDEFVGSCTLKGLNALDEEPDITKMMQKHKKALGII